ncbi:MAG: hypothetical protein RLZ16_230, partial [Bacteroidota bacterium]
MTVISNSRYFAGLILILVLASCTSVKKFTANFNVPRATQNNLKTQAAEKDAIEFLENIAVTPGKIYMKKSSGSAAFETVIVKKTPYDNMPTNLSDVEKANWLQLKYSIKMDVAVEEITNISLLQKIDEWWGTPYCLGGSSKNCVDCSFFTLDVMKQIYKVDLKRTAAQQYEQS